MIGRAPVNTTCSDEKICWPIRPNIGPTFPPCHRPIIKFFRRRTHPTLKSQPPWGIILAYAHSYADSYAYNAVRVHGRCRWPVRSAEALAEAIANSFQVCN